MDTQIVSRLSLSNAVLGILALSWLFFRLNKVLGTPVDDLVKVLGLEVPTAPIVSLLDITANSVSIQWKPPEQRLSVVKYSLRLNGVLVGEIAPQDTSISINELSPATSYTIRVVAVNSANFQASSDAIRVRTGYKLDLDGQPNGNTNGNVPPSAPRIVPYGRTQETATPPLGPTAMVREHSSSNPVIKRGTATRRVSPNAQTEAAGVSLGETESRHDTSESIQELTSRLETLRKELAESERQDEEDEEEYQASRTSLIEKREILRQQLRERDDESKELKKSVTSLERQNTAAQSKKTGQEKLLHQKKNERFKMHEDTRKWNEEAAAMRKEAEAFAKQNEDTKASYEERVKEIKDAQESELQAIRALEEQVREKGTQVKDLEEEKTRIETDTMDNAVTERKRSETEDIEWSERIQALQMQYNATYNACLQAYHGFVQALNRFNQAQSRRGSSAALFRPDAPPEASQLNFDVPFGHPEQHMHPNNAMRESMIINRALASRNGLDTAAAFRSSSPYTNVSAPSSRPPHSEGMTEADFESLTGGALTSPTAGALLPSDLLGDDNEDLSQQRSFNPPQPSSDGNVSRPGSTAPGPINALYNRQSSIASEFLPGLGAIPGLGTTDSNASNGPGPNSPVSFGSNSPSIFSSPQESSANLHQHKLSDSQTESDRRSIKSASGSSGVAQPSKRFGDMFSRQRGKTTSNDGVTFGSLKGHQSRSMPRQIDDITASQLNKRISPGALFGQVSNALARKNPAATRSEGERNAMSQVFPPRGNSISIFSPPSTHSQLSIGDRPASPRPASTYSTENSLPVPLANRAPFGWPSSEDLSYRTNPRVNPWSSFSSRRQSIVQHEPPEEDVEQEDELDEQVSKQAPIGTKPSRSKPPSPPKQLNPNARDFRSMFSRERRADRDKSSLKSKKKDKSPSAEEAFTGGTTDESSPPGSRKSNPAQSTLTASSTEQLTSEDQASDAGTPTTPLERTASATDRLAPGSATPGRESLMQRITRKGSSSKFSLPGLKARKAAAVDDLDEDAVAGSPRFERSAESMSAAGSPLIAAEAFAPTTSRADKRTSGSGFSLSSFKKATSRKKGRDAPSISEASLASEASATGTEEDASELSRRVSLDGSVELV